MLLLRLFVSLIPLLHALPASAFEFHSRTLDLIHSDNLKIIQKSVSDIEKYTDPALQMKLATRKKGVLIAINQLYDLMQNYGEELRTVKFYSELDKEWRSLHQLARRMEQNPASTLKTLRSKARSYRSLLESRK